MIQVPRDRWAKGLWLGANEEPDRLGMARPSGRVVHLGGWLVCGTLHCSSLPTRGTADIRMQARWPERTAPGKFDVIGSSHQIFHVLVVLAAVSHLVGLVTAFDHRHGYAAAC